LPLNRRAALLTLGQARTSTWTRTPIIDQASNGSVRNSVIRASDLPTRSLPSSPEIDHLKLQARELLDSCRAGTLEACQRLREFHPRFNTASDAAIAAAPLTVSDAQLAIAREYGFATWARLRGHVARPDRPNLDRPHHERIDDAVFRRAIDLLDDGDETGLRIYLARHPALVHQRVLFEGGNYFRNPTLLEFVAENPIRHDGLPPNIVAVTKVILDAGARRDQASLDSTLDLVCSGLVAREAGVQTALIDLLCDYGADAGSALPSALAHGEFEAVNALLHRGAALDLTVAAATNQLAEARKLLAAASPESRHRALALAARFGHEPIVRLMLDAGEDPNRYNPVGCHAHSTPLHQAVLAGHGDVVRLLVERGARLDIKDIHHQGTALGWAEHGGQTAIAAYLRAQSGA
jgi:hypothetical protein